MIILKTSEQIALMAKAGTLVSTVLQYAKEHLQDGTIKTGLVLEKSILTAVTLLAEKQGIHEKIEYPFYDQKNQKGEIFHHIMCISVNDEIVHSRPTDKPLKTGDLITVDFGLSLSGWCADAATTVVYNSNHHPVSPTTAKLLQSTQDALRVAIRECIPGNTTDDIGQVIYNMAKNNGFDTVTAYGGHGIGQTLHEEPMIYNCPHTGPKTILRPGMVICLEPMLTQGSGQTVTASDGWKVWTRDGGLAAHEEAMVLITEDGHKVLT